MTMLVIMLLLLLWLGDGEFVNIVTSSLSASRRKR